MKKKNKCNILHIWYKNSIIKAYISLNVQYMAPWNWKMQRAGDVTMYEFSKEQRKILNEERSKFLSKKINP